MNVGLIDCAQRGGAYPHTDAEGADVVPKEAGAVPHCGGVRGLSPGDSDMSVGYVSRMPMNDVVSLIQFEGYFIGRHIFKLFSGQKYSLVQYSFQSLAEHLKFLVIFKSVVVSPQS